MTCPLCEQDMMVVSGCDEYEVLLADGSVISAPRHTLEGSLDVEEPTSSCHDCAAEVGERHHPYCDWAATPDDEQVLIRMVDYRTPGMDDWTGDVFFPIISKEERSARPVTTLFSTREDAMACAAYYEEQYGDDEDGDTFAVRPVKLQTNWEEPPDA